MFIFGFFYVTIMLYGTFTHKKRIGYMEGLFITFEGCEGSGKTTLIAKIEKYFVSSGYKVIKTREPGGSKIAEEIRKIILDVNNTDMDEITEALLYAASRRQHLVEKVIPYLSQGYIVLCDRFLDSSLAYQGYARGIGIDKVYDINMNATEGLLPNLTIYIDLKPEIGLKRIKDNNRNQNRLDKETINFHNKVYQGYSIIMDKFPKRVKSINGEQTPDLVYKDCVKLLDTFLKERGM